MNTSRNTARLSQTELPFCLTPAIHKPNPQNYFAQKPEFSAKFEENLAKNCQNPGFSQEKDQRISEKSLGFSEKSPNLSSLSDNSSNISKNSVNLSEISKKSAKSRNSSKKSAFCKSKLGKSRFSEKKPQTPKKKTFFGVLSDFYLARKFINTLKTVSLLRTPRFLSRNHLKIINDASCFFENDGNFEKTPAFLGFFSRISAKVLKKLPIFDTSSRFLFLWDIAQMLLILYYFFVISLEIVFSSDFRENSLSFSSNLRFFAVAFFFADVFVTFNTSIYLKGEIIKSRTKIAQKYAKSLLVPDLLSVCSLLFREFLLFSANSSENNWIHAFRWLFFCRILKLSTILKRVEEKYFLDQSISNFLALLKLISRIILLSHVFACLWYYVGTIDNKISWIINYDLLTAPWWEKYLNSYYYVCVTMITVGYGDISPQNSLEKLFSIVFIYVACGVFAYSFNSIGVIVSELAKKHAEFERDLSIINGFMRQKDVNFDLRMKVRKYLEYIFYEERIEQAERQEQILNKLSDSLREELLLEANGPFIRDLQLFTFNFSEQFLRNVIPLIKEARFSPGELIFSQENRENKDFYLIRKGKVEVFLETADPDAPLVLKTLKKGDFFGEVAFFSAQERAASARSVDFCTLYRIKRSDFLKLLVKFPQDQEKFNEIKDHINIYADFSDLYAKCYACQQPGHMIHECRLVKLRPLKEILIKKHVFSENQQRNQANRRKLRFNARKNKRNCEKKAELLQETLISDSESAENSQEISKNSEEIDRNAEKAHESLQYIKEIEESQENFASFSKKREFPSSALQSHDTFEVSSKSSLKSLRKTTVISQEKPEKKTKYVENLEENAKSYQFYFPHNNCENVLKKSSDFGAKSTRSLRPLPEEIAGFRQNFFQNKSMLEKFLNKTKFDSERFRENYKKLQEKGRLQRFFMEILRKTRDFLQRRPAAAKYLKYFR